MHIQIVLTWWWALYVAVGSIFGWALYRLCMKFTRPCSKCGRRLLVKRVKIMESDPIRPRSNYFYSYVLGVCPCDNVDSHRTCWKMFSDLELLWRHIFHPWEFNRPDAQILIERAGIDLRGHTSGERVGHKPQIKIDPCTLPNTPGIRKLPYSPHDVYMSRPRPIVKFRK